MLTAEEARRMFSYDRVTGILAWKISLARRVKVGDSAGHKGENGYVRVRIKGKLYYVHRIIFLIERSFWPEHQVDHDNRNPSDNRRRNLCCVTQFENMRNTKMPSTNTSGHVGVHWDRTRNKWAASIKVNRKSRHLGRFDDINDAIAARAAANIKYGFHPNHGSDQQT